MKFNLAVECARMFIIGCFVALLMLMFKDWDWMGYFLCIASIYVDRMFRWALP